MQRINMEEVRKENVVLLFKPLGFEIENSCVFILICFKL